MRKRRQAVYELNQKNIILENENNKIKDCAKLEDYKIFRDCMTR